MTVHPAPDQLALYVRGDLGFWNRRQVEHHLRRCGDCAQAASEFASIQEEMADAAETLPQELSGGEWQALAAEMTANIRLGIAAGECVAPRFAMTGRPRLTLALAGLAVLLVWAGLERPEARSNPPSMAGDESPTLEASESGIAVRASGRSFTVSAPAGQNVIRTVSAGGAIGSRYVDDTGVTIVNVSAE